MKKLLTYLVLYAYVITLVKPVLPIISDTIAHTFYQLEHISVVHQHNGVYHVDKELEEASKDLPANHDSGTIFSKDITPHFASSLAFEAQHPGISLVHSHRYHGALSDAFTVDCFPPPKLFVD